MEKERYILWRGDYLTFWSDGTLSHDDGVGYLDETDTKTVETLYEVMKTYFENESEDE